MKPSNRLHCYVNFYIYGNVINFTFNDNLCSETSLDSLNISNKQPYKTLALKFPMEKSKKVTNNCDFQSFYFNKILANIWSMKAESLLRKHFLILRVFQLNLVARALIVHVFKSIIMLSKK